MSDNLNDSMTIESIEWAPGAMDGVTLYHGQTRLSEELMAGIDRIVQAAMTYNPQEVSEAVESLAGEVPVISFSELLRDAIDAASEEIDADSLIPLCLQLLVSDASPDVKKAVLMMSSIYNLGAYESERSLIRRLSRDEEYSFYTVYHFMAWDNSEEELLALAKETTGWGRIHAVSALATLPLSQESRDWLFYEGVRNVVSPSYSAMTVWRASGAEGRIREESLSYEDFQALGRILSAMMEEPDVDIEILPYRVPVLHEYLRHAESMPLSEEDRAVIKGLQDYIAADAQTVWEMLEILKKLGFEEMG